MSFQVAECMLALLFRVFGNVRRTIRGPMLQQIVDNACELVGRGGNRHGGPVLGADAPIKDPERPLVTTETLGGKAQRFGGEFDYNNATQIIANVNWTF